MAAAAIVAAAGPGLAETATPPSAEAERPPLEAFFDDFDSFDTDRWYISDGWSNGDWQNCTWSRSAVTLRDGRLVLSFAPQVDGSYLCGEIQSRQRADHGTIAARMGTARHSGLNAALFTYIGPIHKKPHTEIDVEILTRDPGSVSFNTYIDGKPKNGATVPLSPAADADWHVYAMQWTPEAVVWTVDGVEVHRTPADAAAKGEVPAEVQKIYLSHWGSETFTDWMGPFVAPSGPVEFEIDWVAYMPTGQECLYPQALMCRDR